MNVPMSKATMTKAARADIGLNPYPPRIRG